MGQKGHNFGQNWPQLGLEFVGSNLHLQAVADCVASDSFGQTKWKSFASVLGVIGISVI